MGSVQIWKSGVEAAEINPCTQNKSKDKNTHKDQTRGRVFVYAGLRGRVNVLFRVSGDCPLTLSPCPPYTSMGSISGFWYFMGWILVLLTYVCTSIGLPMPPSSMKQTEKSINKARIDRYKIHDRNTNEPLQRTEPASMYPISSIMHASNSLQ